MALVLVALGVGQNAGHHAAHRVGHRHGGDLTPREHKVAQGQLLVHIGVDEPLVNPLIMAAYQDQMVIVLGQPHRLRLGEGPATGGQVDGVGSFIPRDLTDVLPALIEWVGLHHRAPPAAIGVVVHLLLLIEGVVPDLVGLDLNIAPLLGPAQDRLAEHVPHRQVEEGHDIHAVHPVTSLQ